jgi:hypothetical protein
MLLVGMSIAIGSFYGLIVNEWWGKYGLIIKGNSARIFLMIPLIIGLIFIYMSLNINSFYTFTTTTISNRYLSLLINLHIRIGSNIVPCGKMPLLWSRLVLELILCGILLR